MGLYAELQNAGYASSANAQTWAATRGKAIMDQYGNSTEPAPFLDDRVALAMDLYHTAMKGHWSWQPTGASAAGGAMLDSVDMKGECKQLVSGFEALLRAPAPYGLGLAQQDVKIEDWPNGGSVQLFVVEHVGAMFGLQPNVLKPDWAKYAGAARFQNLYGWGNHKVLRVNCNGKIRYFDPCYNNVYLLPNEMTKYVLTQVETTTINKQPVVTQYRGRDHTGRPISFRAVGSATPDILKNNIRTVDGRIPILIGPV